MTARGRDWEIAADVIAGYGAGRGSSIVDAIADALAAEREEVLEPIRELAHQFASVASEHRGYPLDSHQTGVRDAYTDVAIRLRRFLEAT